MTRNNMLDRIVKQAIDYILVTRSQESLSLSLSTLNYSPILLSMHHHTYTVFMQMILEDITGNALITACR